MQYGNIGAYLYFVLAFYYGSETVGSFFIVWNAIFFWMSCSIISTAVTVEAPISRVSMTSNFVLSSDDLFFFLKILARFNRSVLKWSCTAVVLLNFWPGYWESIRNIFSHRIADVYLYCLLQYNVIYVQYHVWFIKSKLLGCFALSVNAQHIACC